MATRGSKARYPRIRQMVAVLVISLLVLLFGFWLMSKSEPQPKADYGVEHDPKDGLGLSGEVESADDRSAAVEELDSDHARQLPVAPQYDVPDQGAMPIPVYPETEDTKCPKPITDKDQPMVDDLVYRPCGGQPVICPLVTQKDDGPVMRQSDDPCDFALPEDSGSAEAVPF